MATSIKVEGLSTLAEIPGWIDEGQQKWVDTVGKRLAESIEVASPKSHIPFHAEAIDATTIKITSNHPGARVLDTGAFIKSKGKLLRFTVGGKLVFSKHSRITGRKYTKKGLRKRNSIVKEEYTRIFETLDGHL